MDFEQALTTLLEGKKVRRVAFDKCSSFIEFKKNEDGKETLKMFCLLTDLYLLQGDIITSTDWIVENEEGTHNFVSMMKYLFQGKTASLEEWGNNKWIELGPSRKEIFVHYYIDRPFMLNPEDIEAKDWQILD